MKVDHPVMLYQKESIAVAGVALKQSALKSPKWVSVGLIFGVQRERAFDAGSWQGCGAKRMSCRE